MEDKLKMKNNMKVFKILLGDLFSNNSSRGNKNIKMLFDMFTTMQGCALVGGIGPEEIMAVCMWELSIMLGSYRELPGIDSKKFDEFVDNAFDRMKDHYKTTNAILKKAKKEGKL